MPFARGCASLLIGILFNIMDDKAAKYVTLGVDTAVVKVDQERTMEAARIEKETDAAFVEATEQAEIDAEIRKLKIEKPEVYRQERLELFAQLSLDWQRLFVKDLTLMDDYFPPKRVGSETKKPSKTIKKNTIKFKKNTIKFKKTKAYLVAPLKLDEKLIVYEEDRKMEALMYRTLERGEESKFQPTMGSLEPVIKKGEDDLEVIPNPSNDRAQESRTTYTCSPVDNRGTNTPIAKDD